MRVEHRKNRERGEHERRWRGWGVYILWWFQARYSLFFSLSIHRKSSFFFFCPCRVQEEGEEEEEEVLACSLPYTRSLLFMAKEIGGWAVVWFSCRSAATFVQPAIQSVANGGQGPFGTRFPWTFRLLAFLEGQIFSTFFFLRVTFSSSYFPFPFSARFLTFYWDVTASGRGAIISNKAVEMMAEENKRVKKTKLHRLDIIAGPLGPAGMSVFSSGSFCSIGASKLGNCETKRGGKNERKEYMSK